MELHRLEREMPLLAGGGIHREIFPENIDPDNFKRDVSIFAAYIMEFLCRDVIPLDFSRTAERILAVLQSWQEKSCGLLNLEREVRLGRTSEENSGGT